MTALGEASGPTVWMNVTTSTNWKRSPVGIVRTEQEVFKQLKAKLKHRLRGIVYDEGDFLLAERFTEAGPGIDFWPDASFGESTDLFDPLQRPRFGALDKVTLVDRPKFRYGDVLLTLGLDWESEGLHHTILMLKRKYGLTVISFCYDLIPILYPQYCMGYVSTWFKNYLIDMTWMSDGILCISNATRRDYVNFANDLGLPHRPVEVVYLGSSIPERSPNLDPSDEVKKLIDERFFLFVSTIERRKNHEVLYRAYHLLRAERPDLELPKMVFVGMKGWGIDELMSDITLDPLISDEIVVLSHISDNDLALLYERCEACMFPSHYEGWGLPVAEALEFGKPVLASHAGSIPEVGGNLVRYIDPYSPRDWAGELLRVIESDVSRERWAEKIRREYKSYDWADTAQAIIDFSEVVLSRQSPRVVVEPGYDLSSINGIHYGDKLIYEATTGILCHGPGIGASAGKYRVSAGFTLVDAPSGYLRFIVAHNAGEVRNAVKRVSFEELSLGTHTIEIDFDLSDDATDLEFVCEVHSADVIKLSLDWMYFDPRSSPSQSK